MLFYLWMTPVHRSMIKILKKSEFIGERLMMNYPKLIGSLG